MKRPEVVAAFQDPDDSTKGLFLNCSIGSQCSKINPTKMRGYGLDEFYNTLEPGTQGAHDAALAGALLKDEPVFPDQTTMRPRQNRLGLSTSFNARIKSLPKRRQRQWPRSGTA